VASYNFKKERDEELSIKKNEILVVLDWNYKDGWVLCYKYDEDISKKGVVPKMFIKKCEKPQMRYVAINDSVSISECQKSVLMGDLVDAGLKKKRKAKMKKSGRRHAR